MKPSVAILIVVVLLALAAFFLTIGDDESTTPDTTAPETTIAPDPGTEASNEEAAANEPAPAPTDDSAAAETFTITGTDYEFDVTDITVTEGDTVTINFSSAEGFHDWVVDAFDAATERVRPGEETSVTFTADSAGTYEFYCSVGNHRAAGMVGTLTVLPADS